MDVPNVIKVDASQLTDLFKTRVNVCACFDCIFHATNSFTCNAQVVDIGKQGQCLTMILRDEDES